MLLRQVDGQIGLSDAVAGALRDLVAQRLYGLCCGYEDLNDHAALRLDPLMQTAVGTGEKAAGLCVAPQPGSTAPDTPPS